MQYEAAADIPVLRGMAQNRCQSPDPRILLQRVHQGYKPGGRRVDQQLSPLAPEEGPPLSQTSISFSKPQSQGQQMPLIHPG